MRKSTISLALIALGLLGLVAAGGHLVWRQAADRPARVELARLAKRLQLTDLALFTDARYTRNPTQADRHSPFQDHPAALEHFPSGSLVPPPPPLR